MIDLSGIARKLNLSVEQIRIAADLLQQGYQPAFIQQYRADESGRLPREALWTLKLEIDRQQRLATAKVRLASQLPKDAELDEEAKQFVEKADTEVDIETALRAFRARRALATSQQSETRPGELLEKLVAYAGEPISDLEAWVAQEMSCDAAAAKDLLGQTQRMISSMLLCDTTLTKELRTLVQRRAQIRVELVEEGRADESKADESKPDESATEQSELTEASASDDSVAEATASSDEGSAATSESSTEPAPAESQASETSEAVAAEEPAPAPEGDTPPASDSASTENSGNSEDAKPESATTDATSQSTDAAEPTTAETVPTDAGATSTEADSATPEAAGEDKIAADWPKADSKKTKQAAKLAKKTAKKDSKAKQLAKLTPRQRRRRWLIAMINPMKSLKKPLGKLSAYQLLMLGRGRRSQIVDTNLHYDQKSLVPLARDRFVAKDHPLSRWFSQTVESALEDGVRSRIETDAVAELEERGTESLLTKSVEGLRKTLLQRPVRGHRIMVVDTVGPKVAAVAIVDQSGNVLATDEIPCSALAETVTQNVTRLGELAHKYRVTLVALTNGPARRFLVHTLRELVKQSASSGLRWTMADRSGADAYAAGRVSLRELSAFNRRDRAAIWVARSLQDPLTQYLKVGINRLRLGSFQRELPQEPLKKLVRETIADCVAVRGVDVHSASVAQLLCVPGIHDDQAQQIATLAAQGKIESRAQLLESIAGWTESQSRQAIGMLRVFGSEQTLDATSIHPDDYKLATRIAEATELELPPAAPPGWEKPTPVSEEEASSNAAEDHLAEQASGEHDEGEAAPAEASSDTDAAATTESESLSVEKPAEEAAPAESAEETSEAAASESTTEEPASSEAAGEEPAASDEASTESDSADEAKPADADAAEAGEASSGETETTAEPAAPESPADANQPKPEYSEDVKAAETPKLPVDVEKLARGWQVGRERLRSIAHALHDPFADTRLTRSPVPMRVEMPTLENLQPGQCMWAVVVGVADFGAFVELGPDCGGLIHISRLFDRYVEDPHEVVQVGDLIMTWVVSVDEKKGRVALTALSPQQTAEAEQASRQAREHSGNRGRGGQGGGRGGQRSDSGARGGQGASRGGQGAGRGGQGSARGGQGKPGGGRPGGRSGGNQSGGRSGGRSGGGHRGGGRDRSRGPSKPVIVKSKKPIDPISSAMKEGDEPLRSFGDLMQFYEAKRTDDVPPPKAKEVQPKAPVAEAAASENATSDAQPADAPEAVVEQSTEAQPSPSASPAPESGSSQSGTPASAPESAASTTESEKPADGTPPENA
ncbi:MAG: S1 RNA-binding domain-containing protein [Aureliella sp.]